MFMNGDISCDSSGAAAMYNLFRGEAIFHSGGNGNMFKLHLMTDLGDAAAGKARANLNLQPEKFTRLN